MTERVQIGGLSVAASLHRFVEEEALPGSGLDSAAFWEGASAIVHDLAPRNRELLARRDELQSRIDDWHREHPGRPEAGAYADFLREIGYLLEEPADVAVTTTGVDDEIATIAGPQLVVPLLNARFATNAVNARWGSLYDALYGTDVIPHEGDLAPGDGYNKVRGDEVIARGRAFLDEHFPLATGSHADATSYAVDDDGLAVTVKDDVVRLADPAQLVGFRGSADSPEAVLLVHHHLHVEIQVDADDAIGSTDAAGVKDLLLESAVSTIMDLEDSVAAVDAEDKVLGYRNWLQPQRRHPRRGGHQGRQDLHPVHEPRPDLLHDLRRRRHAARSVAALHPPGRPPDDHRRRARPRRQRGSRGHPGRDHDRARQPRGTCAGSRRWPTRAPARCTS